MLIRSSDMFEIYCNNYSALKKIVAAFKGMHVSPAKHRSASVTRTDRQTDRQTDNGQSDPYVSLRFTSDTKRYSTQPILDADKQGSSYLRRVGRSQSSPSRRFGEKWNLGREKGSIYTQWNIYEKFKRTLHCI